MRTLFLLIFLGLGGNIFVPAHAKSKPRGGQNYYVDAQNGDDRADGKSEKTAWKSLLRTKELQLRAGDSLLLRRNSSFNGLLEVSAEGKAGRPVVIGAYGTGRKPCIQAKDGEPHGRKSALRRLRRVARHRAPGTPYPRRERQPDQTERGRFGHTYRQPG